MPEKISILARNATLRQLQVFESIARHNSFSRAAEELHLTQPTVSMQVKKLSEVLDTVLFERIGRKVYLTASGQALYDSANIILEQLSLVEQKINHIKGFYGGSVSLAVISTAQYFVPKVIQEFTQAYPEVTVILRVGNKETLLERIAKNSDDFYLLGQPTDELNVEFSQLAVNPLAFVANANHPLVGKKLDISDLTNETFLMREKGSGIRTHIDRVFSEFDFDPHTKMVIGGNEATRLALLQNLGITVASVPSLMEDITQNKIKILDVKGFPINRHWYLAYPKGKILSIAAQKMIELLKVESKALSQKSFDEF